MNERIITIIVSLSKRITAITSPVPSSAQSSPYTLVPAIHNALQAASLHFAPFFTGKETLLGTPPAPTLLSGIHSYPESISTLYLFLNKEFALKHKFKRK